MKQLTFGDIVVVEKCLIGVIVKSWVKNNKTQYYEVYVRDYGCIKEYDEIDVDRYLVRHKELSEEDLYYQDNALHPFVDINGKDKEMWDKIKIMFTDPNYEKEFQEWRKNNER